MDPKKKKEEDVLGQTRLLKGIKGSDELNMSWSRKCADVSLLKVNRVEC